MLCLEAAHYGQPSLTEASMCHLECATARPRSMLPPNYPETPSYEGLPFLGAPIPTSRAGFLRAREQADSFYHFCPSQPRKTFAKDPSLLPGPSSGDTARELTKAAEGRLISTEAHPADYGLARGVSTLKRGTQVQGSPSVQCLKIGPGLRTSSDLREQHNILKW